MSKLPSNQIEWIDLIKIDEDNMVEKSEGESFSLLSYNILSQTLVSRDMFPYAAKPILKWKNRCQSLIKHLELLNPDIACLQEVSNYEDYFKKKLGDLGYDTVYYNGQGKAHGCCIAFKTDRFTQMKASTIDLDTSLSTTLPRTMITGNIAQLLALKSNQSPQRGVVLTNTHLYWKNDYDYERLRQAIIIREEAVKFNELKYPMVMTGDFNAQPYKFVYKALTHKPFDQHVFDRMKNELAAALVRAQSKIESTTNEIGTLSTQLTQCTDELESLELKPSDLTAKTKPPHLQELLNKNKALTGQIKSLKTDLSRAQDQIAQSQNHVTSDQLYQLALEGPKLTSLYQDYAKLHKEYKLEEWGDAINEPMFTNYTQQFQSTLDYLFLVEDQLNENEVNGYTKPSRLVPLKLLKLPPPETLGIGLPNDQFPSDHLPIMAVLAW